MLLMEQIFETLTEHDLVLTAEEFSLDWCGKSRSWYAERRHSRRDFSITAAISCLDKVNLKQVGLSLSNRRMGGLLEAEIRALDEMREALKAYLAEQHRITEVALSDAPQVKMLRNQ